MQIAPCHQGVMEHVGVNQSMAPLTFFRYIVVRQGIIWCHQPQALHLQKQPNLLRRSPAPNMAHSMPITCYHFLGSTGVLNFYVMVLSLNLFCYFANKQDFPWLVKSAEISNLSHQFFSWKYDLRSQPVRPVFLLPILRFTATMPDQLQNLH